MGFAEQLIAIKLRLQGGQATEAARERPLYSFCASGVGLPLPASIQGAYVVQAAPLGALSNLSTLACTWGRRKFGEAMAMALVDEEENR